ncbi:MAG: TatD family hydrolase [Lachnospiraceae bacterium]|nr:TatD family hydrolase [Lachnospiraceae bacterium]
MIFDTHAHYDDAQFEEDREEILGNILNFGIGRVVDVGAGLKSTARAVALAKKYPFVYAAAGVHPTETAGLTEQDFLWIGEQLLEEKVVAVGEIGLDYHWDSPRDIQQYWFDRQLGLAVERDMPVIIHSRDAAEDTLTAIRQAYKDAEEHKKRLTGVIHCFSYGVEMAREYVKMGFFLGVGGVLTFKNARRLREVVEQIPLEYLVLETDCPYLAPEPHRGERNSSLNLPLVVREFARIRGITEAEVIRATTENAERLYRL